MWRILKLFPDEKKKNIITQARSGPDDKRAMKKVQDLKWTSMQLIEFMPAPHVTEMINEEFVFDRETGCLELPDNGEGGLGVSLRGDPTLRDDGPETDDTGDGEHTDDQKSD